MTELKSFISQGYKYILVAPGKYVAEYRLVIEKSGKKLKPKLVVHHIDGNRLNNKLSNLLVCTQSQHCKLEKFGSRLKGKKQTPEHIKNWRKSRWGEVNLRTLKDFEQECIKEYTLRFPVFKISEAHFHRQLFPKLKQEAIKWVKELIKLGILGDINSSERHNENMERRSQTEWIKKFFNLTEEDLK